MQLIRLLDVIFQLKLKFHLDIYMLNFNANFHYAKLQITKVKFHI